MVNEFTWKITNSTDDTGEIELFGTVLPNKYWGNAYDSEGMFNITPEGFVDDIKALADKKEINVKLNSLGGDAFVGISIHNILKSLTAKVNVTVVGIAASSASAIMCAGDNVTVYPGSIVMIHEAATEMYGDCKKKDLQNALNAVSGVNDALVAIYRERTGLSETKIRNMMADETWMTGRQAVDLGFADSLAEGSVAASIDGNKLICNGIEFEVSEKAKVVLPDEGREENGMNVNEMVAKIVDGIKEAFTIEEEVDEVVLNEQAVAKAAEDAIIAERKRLQEIDAIADSVTDKKLLAEAKYGEKALTAGELALAAMKAESKVNETMEKAIIKDTVDSKADEVPADVDIDKEQAMIDSIIADFNKTR